MLPSSGIIKMSEINAELKTTGSINLGRADVRSLAGKLSGIIKMSDLHGKSNSIFEGKLTIAHKIYNNTPMLFIDAYGYRNADGHNFGALNPLSLFGGNIAIFTADNLNGGKGMGIIIATPTLPTPDKLKINLDNKITIILKKEASSTGILLFNSYEGSPDSDDAYDFFKANNGKTISVSISV